MADRTNKEGYPDPTAWAALSRVEQEERAQRHRRVKDFLSEAARVDTRIRCKLEQLEALRSLAHRVTGSMTVHTGAVTSGHGRTEDTVLRILMLQRELEEDIDALVSLKRRISELIAAVPSPEHRALLELRYLGFRPWERIAEEMHYSLHHLYKLHNAALEECEHLLTENREGAG